MTTLFQLGDFKLHSGGRASRTPPIRRLPIPRSCSTAEVLMKHIVKVQRPLSGPGPWMVYDKDRRRTSFIEEDKVEPNIREAVGSAPKRYFHAIWSPVDGWKLLEPTLEQTW